MKNILTKSIATLLLLASSIAQAVPTLLFDGNVNFSSQTQRLTVDSILTDTFDILPEPDLTGTLVFNADLISEFTDFGIVFGSFGTIVGQDDISVLDANMDTLLTGNFTSLTMTGNDGDLFSSINGEFVATGGSLATSFGIGNVIALQFNLDTALNGDTFAADFGGHIDGRLEGTAVPEPSILALFGLSLIITGFARHYRIKS